jgi:alanine-glyoxylate transaminase/(R)-3-amino-2-methylpropionate-pyruvate transaminase
LILLQGVVPDIVTMAKGIGNGLPLAAVVTTPEIAATLAARLHFNTFGGNPVCAAGGRAVLRAVDDDGLQANCAAVGGHLLARLRALQARHDVIGDVRGRGLMLGVDLVRDRATKVRQRAGEAARSERRGAPCAGRAKRVHCGGGGGAGGFGWGAGGFDFGAGCL